MPVLGPNNLRLGATQINKAYLGATLLFDGAGPAFDADALAYITAVETADGEALEAGVKDAISDFVVACKADPSTTPGVSNYEAIKASCILAGGRSLNGIFTPFKGPAPTNFNFVTADYNRKTGLKGNGSTKYLNSNRDALSDAQNNLHMSLYLTDASSAGDRVHISSPTGGSGRRSSIERLLIDDSLRLSSRRSLAANDFPEAGGTVGFLGHSRSESSQFTGRFSGANNLIEVASLSIVGGNILIFAQPGATLSLYSDARLSFYSIGESLDLAALDTRVTALMTALEGAIT